MPKGTIKGKGRFKMSARDRARDSDQPNTRSTSSANTTAKQRAWFLLEGRNLFKMSEAFDKLLRDGAEVYEVRGRKRDDGTGVLLTIKARYEGNKIIGWHGGDTFVEALAGAGKKLAAGAMKWREDLPYEERQATAKRLLQEVGEGDLE